MWTRGFGSFFFAGHKRSDDFIPVHKFETEGKADEEKDSETIFSSTWTRE